MAIYDKIAGAYASIQEKDMLRRCVIDPSFLEELAPEGKTLLELACGSGHLSRQIKRGGANQVLGVDICPEMIRIASEQEGKDPRGIEYRIGDALTLGKIGTYDLVAGTFLLHYSKTRDELDTMCRNAYLNLAPNGRFVAINQNPQCIPADNSKYGTDVVPIGQLKEGGLVQVTLLSEDGEEVTFTNYHWERQTYDESLQNAGFTDIKWTIPWASPQAIHEFGEEYFQDWHKHPSVAIVSAVKTKGTGKE